VAIIESQQTNKKERGFLHVILDSSHMQRENENPILAKNTAGYRTMNGLQLTQVRYKIGTRTLFEGIDAHFSAGSVIGIIGNNGCGKSTLLRIMAGVCRPLAGRVLFNTHDIYRQSQKSTIGFVPANPILYAHLTVQENMHWVAKLRGLPFCTVSIALAECNMQVYKNTLFGRLSDGLKKRLSIVIATLHQPALLIVDEPCTALDPRYRAQQWQLLQTWRASSRLIIFSSHHPQEIMPWVDSVYTLQEGQLLRVNTEEKVCIPSGD